MVLITAAGGMWLAPTGERSLNQLALVWLCTMMGTALVVSSANSLNCWIERDVDRHMTRTQNRPLPAGRMDPRVALVFGVTLGSVAVPLLGLLVNPLTGLLAAVALVSYVAIYTPLKQATPVALLIGAVPGAMPPLMGWTAMTGSVDAAGLVLFATLFFWQLPHFIAISMFRQSEYTNAGIKVLPAVRGRKVAKQRAALYGLLLAVASVLFFPLGTAGGVYLVIMGTAGALFAALCFSGLRPTDDTHWARSVFFASLVYLPLLFAALMIDRAVASAW